MKMEGWAERIGVGLIGLVLGVVVMVGLVFALHFWWWPMLAIPVVCMLLAMWIGDPVIDCLKGLIRHDPL